MKKNLNSQKIILFVEMKISKLINYSIYMCQSCQCTTLLVSLVIFKMKHMMVLIIAIFGTSITW